jgi:MFS family permease
MYDLAGRYAGRQRRINHYSEGTAGGILLHQASNSATGAVNRTARTRMAVIAAFSHNVTIGCLFGSFGVLMTSVEQRLGVSRELSSLGISAVTVSSAILAPLVGALAARYSLRALFSTGAILSVLGYALLAFTHSYSLYLVAYGLFLGPGMAFSAVVLPSTLVTRWFDAGRGKVLGLVHVPVVISIVPLVTSLCLARYGVPVIYAAFAVLIAVILVPLAMMVIDHPPGVIQSDAKTESPPQVPAEAITVSQFLRSPRFWAFAISSAVIITGVVVLNTHMIPMVGNWGISVTAGATLISVCALAGIPGSVMWGWIADKIGGGPAMTVCILDYAILWAILLTNPHYPVALLVIGLLGLHGGASIPLMGMALSQTFGQANFSRAYGLATMMTLPFTVIGIQSASAMFVKTGSYVLVITVMIAAFLLISPLPYLARRRRTAAAA